MEHMLRLTLNLHDKSSDTKHAKNTHQDKHSVASTQIFCGAGEQKQTSESKMCQFYRMFPPDVLQPQTSETVTLKIEKVFYFEGIH